MEKADALCVKPTCRSHDIRYVGRSEIHWYPRPVFLCGSCGSEWTSGNDGEPYMSFAVPYEKGATIGYRRITLYMDEEDRVEQLKRNKSIYIEKQYPPTGDFNVNTGDYDV